MPKRRKPPRVVLDSISGRGTTPEYDLIPMGPNGPKCGKNSLPLSFTTESSATKRPPECLLRSRHKPADMRRLPHLLGQGAGKEQVRAILHRPSAHRAFHERVREHAAARTSSSIAVVAGARRKPWSSKGDVASTPSDTSAKRAGPPMPPGLLAIYMLGRWSLSRSTPTRPGLPLTSSGRQGAPATSAAQPPAGLIMPRAEPGPMLCARPAVPKPPDLWIMRRGKGKPHWDDLVWTSYPPRTGKSPRSLAAGGRTSAPAENMSACWP